MGLETEDTVRRNRQKVRSQGRNEMWESRALAVNMVGKMLRTLIKGWCIRGLSPSRCCLSKRYSGVASLRMSFVIFGSRRSHNFP